MSVFQFLFSLWLRWFARPGVVRSLTVGGRKRTYFVRLPRGHDPARPAPVVLAFHGATMNGPMMAWFTGLNEKADAAGFIVVYPEGTGRRGELYWNAGNCCGPAVDDRVDDVAFVRALLDDLAAAYPIDPRRVFATGMSNGAMMAYRVAAELADRIAAVATVAGPLAIDEPKPARPVPVLHFHGTEDEFTPFAGGRGRRSISGVCHRSAEESVRAWVKANGCNEVPTTEELPDAAGDGARVEVRTFAGPADVVLVVIHGGGHTWPGRPSPAKNLGRSTAIVSANDRIWEFFAAHPLP